MCEIKKEDMEQLIDEAACKIVEASKFAALFSLTSVNIGMEIPNSLFYNIRDAMVHFKVINEACLNRNYKKAYKHYSNMNEHLIRGQKDAIITYIQYCVKSVDDIIQQNTYFNKISNGDKINIQNIIHELKNTLLDIRLAGLKMTWQKDTNIETYWNSVVQCSVDLNEILEKNELKLF